MAIAKDTPRNQMEGGKKAQMQHATIRYHY
jgi:hypothetical protein